MLTDGVTTNRVKVGVWLVAEDRDRPYDGSDPTDNPLQERTRIRVPLMTVDVRLTGQFGVQVAATVPDVTRTAVVPRPSGTLDYRETFHGFGDMSVLGWYRLRPIRRWNAIVNVGTSIPTGRTEIPRFRSALDDGSLVPDRGCSAAPGRSIPWLASTSTGSFAGSASLAASPRVCRRPRTHTACGPARHGRPAAACPAPFGTHRIVGYGRLGWLHRQHDVFNGTPVLVGGGNWLYITPGVAVLVGRGLQAQAEVKLPAYRSLANRQLDSSAIVQFGISRAFGR